MLYEVITYIAAKELDVLIAPKDVVEHYANGLEMTDLASLIKNTTALSKEISQSLVQTVGPDGEKKAYLVITSYSIHYTKLYEHMLM